MNNIAREISLKIHAGQCQAALAMAAAIRAKTGSQPQAGAALASMAGASRDARLLSAAFALWPEAQSSSFSQLAKGISPKSLAGCLAMRPDLLPQLATMIKTQPQARPAAAKLSAPQRPAKLASLGVNGPVAAPRAIAARRGERGSSQPSSPAAIDTERRSQEGAAEAKARMRSLLGLGPIDS